MKRNSHREKTGFSLVEVNMAILVIGLGMLVLFGLFPTGLREGENALVETHAALFADAVFNALRAEAADQNMNWSTWQTWRPEATIPAGSGPIRSGAWGTRVLPRSVEFPRGSGETIFYIMEYDGVGPHLARPVWLWVQSSKHATDDPEKFKLQAQLYYSAVFYSSGRND